MAALASDDTLMRSPEGTKTKGSKVQADEFPLLSKGEEKSHSLKGEATKRSAEEMDKLLNEMETKFAAYVRHDRYGTMGTGDISVQEKAVLVFALLVLVPIKIVLLFLIVFTYYLICKLCTMGRSHSQNVSKEANDDSSGARLNGGYTKSSDHAVPDVSVSSPIQDETYADLGGLRRKIVVYAGRFLSRAILFVLGFFWISVIRLDEKDVMKDGRLTDDVTVHPSAIVSNHVSYIDILYHMSASFPSFVAKRSVARLYLVGLISKCLGCVYVQREDKPSDFKGVSGIICERLRAKDNNKESPLMMLFPEGTTTNGNYLLPFKTGAFVAGTPVQPVILKYPYRRFSPAWDTISGVSALTRVDFYLNTVSFH
ncbi:hypothetical protein KP509_17G080900 [Ceratopteris richardii]|uniref:Phospholipid/glycerol acyltransferase domain-containing protein n=1 Tax=Ceratopteris richardii TaxID=49495 RepID=A0A8T2SZG6_CERRI|nr:hypothetical protein KP509_17G080900 [Ceratopteris richardii]